MRATDESEITRLEGFSDAVFALSATLLVVSLEVPQDFAAMVAELQGFLAFIFSFAALICIWAVHNGFFRRYALQDSTTIALNSCLLFVVLFYVYPLKFVSEGLAHFLFSVGSRSSVGIHSFDELAAVFMLYSLGFLLIFLFIAFMYLHAARKHEKLKLNAAQQAEAWFFFRHYLLFSTAALLSIFVAWLQVGIHFGLPGFIYGLLGPMCWLHSIWSQKRSLF